MVVYKRIGKLDCSTTRYVVGPSDRQVLLEDFSRLRAARRWAEDNKDG
jgi:hypothetical protein